ncbi:hypothetical protein [Candidatus Nitrospira bockiana]
MRRQGALSAIAYTALLVAACSSGPELQHSTRTGKIYDVRIGETLNPEELHARQGDEVRFVNARSAPVRIVFVEDLNGRLACEKGFLESGMFNLFSSNNATANSARIKANDYASLCFLSPGHYTYTARMEAPVPGGEKNQSGRLVIE